ncbi:MAG: TlyA family RNA methyltransferase [Puniceicoccaceae bacterium]|jgi:23S rRNA (cytidine1920-2'-O)/16S rRNA (cytidine1409-2'-O)-methyltransferase|nr:TlyA family RNA methyltransferase [Puniceicoccaceae bacterium]MBL6838492.1 TlyA family RNA methyltransferase [Puniceicoccaceae bacterium]MBL6913568.1 TlyA family RNA methyltransferase [Puniceicoccaceae bacterium]
MAKSPKQRLDELLVAKGLADSRSQAKALILAGKVKLGTERLDKPGRSFPQDSELTVEAPPRFVSRGGEKLEGFLDRFNISVQGLPILDVGASTGGFTDCCLQRGAISATCVDVGRAQMHNKLIQDDRVTNLEKTNARHLQPGDLPQPTYPRVVMDLSFISLTKVLPAVWQFIEPGGCLIALVKPQFEAEKNEVDAGRGIIRDEAIHERVLATIQNFALRELHGAELIGTMDSPIKGTDGNREFLLGLRRV